MSPIDDDYILKKLDSKLDSIEAGIKKTQLYIQGIPERVYGIEEEVRSLQHKKYEKLNAEIEHEAKKRQYAVIFNAIWIIITGLIIGIIPKIIEKAISD